MNTKRAIAAALSLSSVGLSLIQNHEGLSQIAYLDAAGFPTICYGHMEPSLKAGTRYSKHKCEQLLVMDTKSAGQTLSDYVKVPLTQNQYDALLSLVFNIGRTAFARSSLLKKLNDGDYQGAADEFPRWVYAGGKRLDGLVVRRDAERTLFLKDN